MALAGAFIAGGMLIVWISGLSSLPNEVASLKATAAWQADSIYQISERTVWIVCTTVPPNRPDVLAALRISTRCPPDIPTLFPPTTGGGP